MRVTIAKHGILVLLGLASLVAAVPSSAQVVKATVKINVMI